MKVAVVAIASTRKGKDERESGGRGWGGSDCSLEGCTSEIQWQSISMRPSRWKRTVYGIFTISDGALVRARIAGQLACTLPSAST